VPAEGAWSGFENLSEQNGKTVPRDLDADAKQDEGYDAQDAVRGIGRNDLGDPGCIGIAEVDQQTEDNDGEEDSDVGENVFCDNPFRDMRSKGEDGNQSARAGGYWKCVWVKGLLFQIFRARFVTDIRLFLLVPRVGGCVFLIEHRPPHGGDNDAAGELNDGQRDAKEVEDARAEQFNNGQKDDVIDGDSAGKGVIDLWGRIAYQAEEDQSGPERIDQRQQHAEGDEKRVPDLQSAISLPRG